MQIRSLKNTSPERYTLTLEDGTEIRTTLGVVTDLRLFEGKDLTEVDTELLREHSLRSLCLEKGIELLSRRMMSEKELKRKLTEKGADEAAAEYCALRLTDMGFLDDERYAAAVARHYSKKGYGAGRVRAELGKRGIPRDLWDDALEEMVSADGKLDAFLRSRLTDPSDRAQVQKVSAALYRRGYSWDQIRSALSRYSEAQDGSEDELEIIEEDP